MAIDELEDELSFTIPRSTTTIAEGRRNTSPPSPAAELHRELEDDEERERPAPGTGEMIRRRSIRING
jgi:hypothetical protein